MYFSYRSKEGWLFLATVIDLFSREIIWWQTGSRQTTDLIENALSKAVQRISKKESNVILHSDQGSQYSSYDY
ncbi:MAG: DDE-type integrase/transposase/recombinase [Campylobacterales bacterium]|nr:DDE-type integrase/transposase/recombinase [Campylobacterales bacterium]